MLQRKLRTPSLPPRSYAEIKGSALRSNFSALRKLAQNQEILPMIKADAYGHGADWAARELAPLHGVYGLGVATLEEGMRLRDALGPKYRKTRILVFSGVTPWSEDKGQLCERYGLVPIISRSEDWDQFLKQGWPGRISYELKFNTGMNRLGIHFEKTHQILKSIQKLHLAAHPQGILSHLAMGEAPDAPLSRKQLARFKEIRSIFESTLPQCRFHLANSAGIWNAQAWQLRDLTDVVRPGIALYGVTPWKTAPTRDIEPVMTLRSQILSIHQLKAGESVGYGARFTVQKDPSSPRRVAILASGYADGIHRYLSSRGSVQIGGRMESVLGTVSMDLCAVSCPSTAKVGQYAVWIGEGMDLWKQAENAGTIPYEILTSVSGRVQRVYV